jgi:hypothetical protein
MIVIIPKDETRFGRIYFRFMFPLAILALLFSGFGIYHYQTAESPAKIDPVLFRTWGTGFCVAAFVFLTFIGPLVLTLAVFVWRWFARVFTKRV